MGLYELCQLLSTFYACHSNLIMQSRQIFTLGMWTGDC